jgi:hypothetical protein
MCQRGCHLALPRASRLRGQRDEDGSWRVANGRPPNPHPLAAAALMRLLRGVVSDVPDLHAGSRRLAHAGALLPRVVWVASKMLLDCTTPSLTTPYRQRRECISRRAPFATHVRAERTPLARCGGHTQAELCCVALRRVLGALQRSLPVATTHLLICTWHGSARSRRRTHTTAL